MTRRNQTQLALGLVVLALGILALLSQLGFIDIPWGTVWSNFWPILLIGMGLFALISNPRTPLGPLVLIGVGAILLLTQLDIIGASFWDLFWPLVLIAIGLGILFRIFSQSRESKEATVNATAIMWGSSRKSFSQDFQGGSVTAIMGGVDVDLRGADIVKQADISVFTFWGGVEINVPTGWRVELHGLPILGGWENKAFIPPDPNAPVLRVNATCIMGGLTVRNKVV